MLHRYLDTNIVVSDAGKVFKIVPAKKGHVTLKPVQPKYTKRSGKYPVCWVRVGRVKKLKALHIIVATALYGNLDGKTVHHCNHNTSDYSSKNLCVVSRETHNIIERQALVIVGNLN